MIAAITPIIDPDTLACGSGELLDHLRRDGLLD